MNKTRIIKHWNLLQRKLNPANMALLALSTLLVVGCDQQKAAIDANRDEAQDAIDARKEVVAAEAVDAAKRTDLNATIDKAGIEAEAIATKASLDAEKIKIDAKAAADKATVDALKSR